MSVLAAQKNTNILRKVNTAWLFAVLFVYGYNGIGRLLPINYTAKYPKYIPTSTPYISR